MVPMLRHSDAYEDASQINKDRQEIADGEQDDADIIYDYFREKITLLGLNPDKACIWLQSPVMAQWCKDILPFFGGRTGKGASHKLRVMAKTGQMPNLSSSIEKFPSKKGRRGLMWNWEEMGTARANGTIHIVERHSSGEIRPRLYS